MKLIDVVNASEPLKRLTEKRFNNYKVLRLLVKLRKAVETEVEFYVGEEKKAINLYAEMDEKGNPVFLVDGRLQLKDVDSRIAFEKEIEKLKATEVDGIKPVLLREEDFCSTGDYPTPSDMVLLESVIEFGE